MKRRIRGQNSIRLVLGEMEHLSSHHHRAWEDPSGFVTEALTSGPCWPKTTAWGVHNHPGFKSGRKGPERGLGGHIVTCHARAFGKRQTQPQHDQSRDVIEPRETELINMTLTLSCSLVSLFTCMPRAPCAVDSRQPQPPSGPSPTSSEATCPPRHDTNPPLPPSRPPDPLLKSQ